MKIDEDDNARSGSDTTPESCQPRLAKVAQMRHAITEGLDIDEHIVDETVARMADRLDEGC